MIFWIKHLKCLYLYETSYCMRDIFNQVKFYFTYHRKDKYGIIVLLILCVTLLIVPEIYYHTIGKKKIIDHINITHEKFAELVKKFEAAKEISYVKEENLETDLTKIESKPIDINLATAAELKILKGIGNVFSKRITKYRDSKNGFDKIEDLKNVYGITDSLYEALLPHIAFTSIKKTTKKKGTKQKNFNNDFKYKKDNYKFEKKETAPVMVDINTATANELKQLKGIGPVLSERIVKFRNAMGGFENIEQLNDVYGIEDSLYFTLLDNIEMSKVEKPVKELEQNFEGTTASAENTKTTSYQKTTENKPAAPSKPKRNIIVDINKASEGELEKLNGIGNFRAKEIVAQRERLGGFYSIEQIKEVYSFDDSLYLALKPQLSVANADIKKININTVEFKALLKHPYFDYNLTKNVINFRDNRKGLKNLEELKESFLIDDVLYEKLIKYLTLE